MLTAIVRKVHAKPAFGPPPLIQTGRWQAQGIVNSLPDQFAFRSRVDRFLPLAVTLPLNPLPPGLLSNGRNSNAKEDRYIAKGGAATFNCKPVVLTDRDIDELELAILNGELPSTSGFFFGQSDGSEIQDDLAFVAAARSAIAEGKAVIYDSWW